MPALIYDPAYLTHETGPHPETSDRLRVILKALESDVGLWKQVQRISPSPATEADLTRCHSGALVEQIRTLCERGARFIDMDTAISPESFDVAKLAAGAAIKAVDVVMKGDTPTAFALIRPPGHHATPTRAMGFCLFNNVAVGARYAQAKYGVENVLIMDWDVHHGNGTQEIFWTDPTVFYFSTHQYPYYPGTGAADEHGGGKGEGFTLNVPLRAGTSARAHREAFSDALKSVKTKFHPDLVMISAGFDSRRGDPLGGLMLEDGDFSDLTKELLDLADHFSSGRLVSLLEGGYNLRALGRTVSTHLEALRY